MSYTVDMTANDIVCKIPIEDLTTLNKEFESITIEGDTVEILFHWEEDDGMIKATIENDTHICLAEEQQGNYKNSSDGGLGYLLETYKGTGLVSLTGEDSETEHLKYTDGIKEKGKVVFQ